MLAALITPDLGFELLYHRVPIHIRIDGNESAYAVSNFNFFTEIEKIELAEDVFGTNVPVDMAFDNPHEVVDYLVLQLRGWGPSSFASDFLRQLATKRNSPGLAEGLHDSWRREQIVAVVQEIFDIGDLSAGGDDDSVIPVRRPRVPTSGSQATAQSLDDNPSSHR